MTLDDIKEMTSHNMPNMDKKGILNTMGLDTKTEPTEYILPVLAIFGAGLLTGIGAALLLAPKSGKETRGDIEDTVESARHKAMDTVRDASERVAN